MGNLERECDCSQAFPSRPSRKKSNRKIATQSVFFFRREHTHPESDGFFDDIDMLPRVLNQLMGGNTVFVRALCHDPDILKILI